MNKDDIFAGLFIMGSIISVVLTAISGMYGFGSEQDQKDGGSPLVWKIVFFVIKLESSYTIFPNSEV